MKKLPDGSSIKNVDKKVMIEWLEELGDINLVQSKEAKPAEELLRKWIIQTYSEDQFNPEEMYKLALEYMKVKALKDMARSLRNIRLILIKNNLERIKAQK